MWPRRCWAASWFRPMTRGMSTPVSYTHLLAFTVDDYAAAHALHKEMGCICFENEAMGIYFIADPDGYWLEIVLSLIHISF